MSELTDDERKEIYALFGLAYSRSESLHRGLCLLYTYFGFEKKEHVIRQRIEERLSYSFSLTFGQIVNEIKDEWLPGLRDELNKSKEIRNYLAHNFWFENIPLHYIRDGYLRLVKELDEAASMFDHLDDKVMKIVNERNLMFGLTEDVIKVEMEKVRAGQIDELDDTPVWKKIKKTVKVLKSWTVPGEFRGRSGLIFESEEGDFYQLSDVGLCFSSESKRGDNWTESNLKKYLPSLMESRPNCRAPWNYDLKLKGNVLLRVGFNDETGLCTLKIKTN